MFLSVAAAVAVAQETNFKRGRSLLFLLLSSTTLMSCSFFFNSKSVCQYVCLYFVVTYLLKYLQALTAVCLSVRQKGNTKLVELKERKKEKKRQAELKLLIKLQALNASINCSW